MKYIIIHGSVISGREMLKVGKPIELEPEEAKKMGGDAVFVEAAKYEAQQRAAAAAKAELAKAGITPDPKPEPKPTPKAEKGGR